MYDIVTVGSSTMDVFIKSQNKILKVKTRALSQEFLSFPLGSKILIDDIDYHTGGGGTNTAITFAKSSLKTGFLGSIGKDHNGDKILSELKKSKVKFLGTVHKKTGYSVILEDTKDRTILTYKGCNGLEPTTIKNLKKIKTKWFYIASVTKKAYDFTISVSHYAKMTNAKICFNPSSYMAKKGFIYINPILKNTFCLILNNDEASLLTKNQDVKENLKILSKKISLDGIVIITCGKKGAYCYNNNLTYEIKPKTIKVIETTGAGDAFGSGFIAGLIKKKPIEFCLKMAINNSEHVIQHYGAKNGLLGKGLIHLANQDERKVKKYE